MKSNRIGLVLGVFLTLELAQAGRNCEMVFQACPEKFDKTTITVPNEVIWLNPVVPVCDAKVMVPTQGLAKPPSIVFIIDNSGSMSEDKDTPEDPGNDPDEARFEVVKTLLDTIHAASPAAEVGLVIFTRRLAFDHRDNALFKPAFPEDTSQHDSYVPLTALNTIFSNGVSGIDTLKDLLKYHGNGNLDYNTQLPGSRLNSKYGPTSTRDGTDITLGFQAAQEAMKAAKADSSDRYFIFLSDGESSNLDEGRTNLKDTFVQGTNTPTTFTVYFKRGSGTPTVPTNIKTMTENISKNSYSTSNPKSKYWAIGLPASELLTLLQVNVFNTILLPTASKPARATLAVSGTSQNNVDFTNGKFTFPTRIPLKPDQTEIAFSYTYSYLDSGLTREKTVPYTLTVKRSNSVTATDSIGSVCRESASLALYNQGRVLQTVTGDDEQLDVHLNLPLGETCSPCHVQVTPASNLSANPNNPMSRDSETLALTPVTGYQIASFKQFVNPIPVPANGNFEHLTTDSLVLLYSNPLNPLDAVRRAYPYSDYATRLDVSFYNSVAHLPLAGTATLPAPSQGQSDKHWALGGVNTLPILSGENEHCCLHLNTPFSGKDSLAFLGVNIEASRAFKVEIAVFSNLGQFVNQLDLSLLPSEFDRLPKGAKSGTRSMAVYWNNRSEDGSRVGTGAYILRTKVTLLPIAGNANEERLFRQSRRVGVVRSE